MMIVKPCENGKDKDNLMFTTQNFFININHLYKYTLFLLTNII